MTSIQHQQQAMDRLDLAKSAYDAKQFDRALGHIRRAVELDPQNTAARVLQARIYLKQNKPNLAMSALRAHEKLAPQMKDTPEVAMLRAEALSASGFDRIAQKQLRKLASQLPDDVRPYRMLSGLHVKLKEFNEAIDSLKDVVRLTPSDRAAERMLSEMLQERDPQDGIEMMLDSKTTADEPGLLLRAAQQCIEVDRLRDADELYRKILNHQPDDAGVLLDAGHLADELGEDELAVERLSKAISLPGEHVVEAYEALARVHAHAGRYEQAIWFAWKATRLDSRNMSPWAGLVVYAQANGRVRLAERAVRHLQRYTGSRQRQQMLAKAWQDVAGPLAIEEGLSEIPPTHPGQSTLQTLLKRSAHTLTGVISQYPQRADAQYHLAVCHHLLDDPSEANLFTDQALAINPKYDAALRLAEQIEEKLAA